MCPPVPPPASAKRKLDPRAPSSRACPTWSTARGSVARSATLAVRVGARERIIEDGLGVGGGEDIVVHGHLPLVGRDRCCETRDRDRGRADLGARARAVR